MSYTSGLQDLYNDGKTQLNDTIDDGEAQNIIEELGVDFGTYADEVSNSIVGLTRIEAFAFLGQFLATIDAADGSFDQKIDTSEKTFEELLIASGLISDDDDASNNEQELASKLNNASDVFKQDSNPSDEQYIEDFKTIQDSDAPTGTETEELLGDSLTTLDPSVANGDGTQNTGTGNEGLGDIFSIIKQVLSLLGSIAGLAGKSPFEPSSATGKGSGGSGGSDGSGGSSGSGKSSGGGGGGKK